MSAYISILTPAGGYLFTDGAAYNEAGVLMAVGRKVTCGTVAPIAVTSVGNKWLGDKLQEDICQIADNFGVDEMLKQSLSSFLGPMQASDEFRSMTQGKGSTAVLIAAYSEKRGRVVHCTFQTMDEVDPDTGDINAAYQLRMIDEMFTARGPFEGYSLENIRQPLPGEDIDAFVRYAGIAMMEHVRTVPSVSKHLEGTATPPYHMVGGHIDLTVVKQKGARVERIKVWDDKIGQKISLRKPTPTIEPFTGMSRQQRRAAERAQRKSA